MEDKVLRTHYHRLASNYDEYLAYSPDFIRRHTSKRIEHLELTEDDVLVDIVCGPGMYTIDILAQRPLKRPVLAVDPFTEMLERIPEGAPVERITCDALTFSEQESEFTKVLIKETIHHVDQKREFFEYITAVKD